MSEYHYLPEKIEILRPGAKYAQVGGKITEWNDERDPPSKPELDSVTRPQIDQFVKKRKMMNELPEKLDETTQDYLDALAAPDAGMIQKIKKYRTDCRNAAAQGTDWPKHYGG